ncbi:MarR family winged helix-turn-helix transcriptional regulator [Nonomuraea sp. 3N208]|uniref:MarR family winged helix-turn-helix transcriptional regulator n=1 Tax=Nonomuraea sp. 3N208 TaxID=3457421 RepID=UPI003FD40D9B
MTQAASSSGSTDVAIPRPSLLYVVKQIELAARSLMDELLKPTGITALQYTALTVLRRRDGLSSAQLARNSFVTAQSMADMITALERRGLIVRRRDPDNRRALLISLTDVGHELLAAHDEAMDALEERMLSGLTPRQRRDLEVYLNRCRTALSDLPPH